MFDSMYVLRFTVKPSHYEKTVFIVYLLVMVVHILLPTIFVHPPTYDLLLVDGEISEKTP